MSFDLNLNGELKEMERPFITFVRKKLEKNPYETFCLNNEIQAFDNLPMLLLKTRKKGALFDDVVTHNMFLPDVLKGYLFDTYVAAKRQCSVLRQVIVTHARRRRKSQTSMDLSLAPFGPPSTRMDVFDGGKKYTFKTSDMLNLIQSSLTHSLEFICDPVPIKNPYTGLVFGKPTLYSIYLLLKESRYVMPPLFLLYMEVDFELKLFEVKYESVLRDIVIKSHIDNMSVKRRRDEIRDMMTVVTVYNEMTHRCEPIFRLKSVKPEEYDQFTKWLHLYFLHLYSLNTYYGHVSFRKLIREMLTFRAQNPMFGCLKGKLI
jgi:hypothetical protein